MRARLCVACLRVGLNYNSALQSRYLARGWPGSVRFDELRVHYEHHQAHATGHQLQRSRDGADRATDCFTIHLLRPGRRYSVLTRARRVAATMASVPRVQYQLGAVEQTGLC